MFMGSLFLLLACAQIFWRNSYPVWNMLFGSNDAGPENVMQYYNVSQGAFAVFVSFFVGFGQYLRYKGQAFSVFFKKIALSLFVSIALTVISLFVFKFSGTRHSSPLTGDALLHGRGCSPAMPQHAVLAPIRGVGRHVELSSLLAHDSSRSPQVRQLRKSQMRSAIRAQLRPMTATNWIKREQTHAQI